MPKVGASNPPAIFGANLLAWYKADVGVFADAGVTPATNGSAALQWNDQSGHGYNVGPGGASFGCTYATAGFNTSYPAVVFPSINALQAMVSGGITLGGTVLSAFFVGQMDTVSNYGRAVALRDPGQPNDFDNDGSILPMLEFSTGATMEAFRNSNATGTLSITLSTPYRMASVADGTNLTAYLNGGTGSPVASTGTFANPITLLLGGGITAGAVATPWWGRIAEVVLANVAASGGQLSAMDAYLKAKWGL